MSNESPPGSSRPPAGGGFTWPPTSEELDSIEVIALEGSPPATTTSVPTTSVTTTSVTTTPVTTPSSITAPELPATLVVPAAARDVTRRPRPRLWMQRPSREDFVYVGVTLTSALAIAVAGTQQLSDWRHAQSQPQARTDAPLTAAAPAATSPVAHVALLHLLENSPADAARTAVAAATPPIAALADAAAPIAARTADGRTRRASRVTMRPQHTYARRATSTQRASRDVAPRARRTNASAASAAAIASPPLRLPESYVKPRLVSQEGGRRRGQVVLAVHVRPNGRVGDVEVLSRRDDRRHDDLERAAVSAVKQWRYRPALRDGVPAPARVKVIVEFS